MLASTSHRSADQAGDQHPQFDPNLRALLDHLAVELANEYIRLMESAAETGAEAAAVSSA